MQHNPLVSVIIPTYNRANLISRSLQSVLGQTYKNWEIILVDDASHDNIEEVIMQEKKRIPNITYLKNTNNCGVSYSRNVGIKHAKGDYIAFLDSDDIWHPYHLEESISTLLDTGYKICSALWDINQNGEEFYIGDMEWFKERLLIVQKELHIDTNSEIWKFDHEFYEFVLKTGFYCFQINTVVLEKKILLDIGLFNEDFRMNEDIEFLYRIFSRYSLVTLNRSHFVYHYGDDNLWAFVDRENGYKNFSPEIMERLYRNLGSKIEFYQLLEKTLQSSLDSLDFKDPDAVFDSIFLNIMKRCLTIMLCSGTKCEQFEKYHLLAKRYARSDYSRFLLENYDKDEVVSQYFSLY